MSDIISGKTADKQPYRHQLFILFPIGHYSRLIPDE